MRKIEDIIWIDEVDSTNNMAKCHIEDYHDMTVLSARNQTRGRGQRGNIWITDPDKNLTFSIILKHASGNNDSIRADKQFILSELTSLSVVSFLEIYGIEAKIKWPNDIYVGNRKICGMLIENTIKGRMLGSSVIGIGLNVNQTIFPTGIYPEPTSVMLETVSGCTKGSIDLEKSLERFLEIFCKLSMLLDFPEGCGRLYEKYNSLIYRKDEEHRFILKSSGEIFNGVIKSVSPAGLLQMKTKEGETLEFAFNEISYVI